MPTRRSGFRILAGVDGSPHARAALAVLLRGPWPDDTRVRAVVARRMGAPHHRSILLAALDRRADEAAGRARELLAERWPDAEVVVADRTAHEAILAEARAFQADVIAVGWRGHGAARGLLMGSVSRGIVRGAACAVLVVRRAPERVRQIVVAFDGSANAVRAVNLVGRLKPARGGRVTLVQAVQAVARASGAPRLAGIQASVAAELSRINAERSQLAEAALQDAAATLSRAGWRTRIVVQSGEPLREVLRTVASTGADLVVVGARGTSGVRHLLLGSVAEGVLSRSTVPVLLAR